MYVITVYFLPMLNYFTVGNLQPTLVFNKVSGLQPFLHLDPNVKYSYTQWTLYIFRGGIHD